MKTEHCHRCSAVSALQLLCHLIDILVGIGNKFLYHRIQLLALAMLCFQGDQVYPFYIGDSRIYLYNGTDLYRLTSDHTLANHKLQTGIYTKEEAELSSDRNKLIQFLGADLQHFTLPHAAKPPLRIYRGYRFLLCSDGLTDMCDDQTIYRVLSSGQPDMANELMQLAMDAGGVDNTTLILIEVL